MHWHSKSLLLEVFYLSALLSLMLNAKLAVDLDWPVMVHSGAKTESDEPEVRCGSDILRQI